MKIENKKPKLKGRDISFIAIDEYWEVDFKPIDSIIINPQLGATITISSKDENPASRLKKWMLGSWVVVGVATDGTLKLRR